VIDHRDDRSAHGLDRVRKVFEELGRTDPLYAALSKKAFRGNRWDPAEFFASGAQEIAAVMAYVDAISPGVARTRALDFGCAVGRLSQALASHFAEVVGVDIAEAMIAQADQWNRHGDRVRYVVNTAPNLHRFESNSFDFVYSNKVLQHIPPEYQEGYISEFVRLLRPGGTAVFQTRNGARTYPGTPRRWLYILNRIYLRRLFQKVRGRPAYEMHDVARSRVEEIVAAAGGQIVDVVDLSLTIRALSLRYCVRKPG
jgi:2-polyprenyl-3-methyl-5-hydroxy-6-metoxy-1,4-benzoquinol methylase